MLSYFRKKRKAYKQRQMIEKDKGSMHPTHFPLVMSAMEREYLENAFKTHNQIVGGGGVNTVSLVPVAQPFWLFCILICVLQV